MTQAIVESIQVGQPRELHDGRRAYRTAIFKEAVTGPVWVSRLQVEGDAHADPKYSGGPDRAVLGYSVEHLARWRAAHAEFDFPNGCFGENFSISGLDETTVCIGDVWAVGEVILEVTYPRLPCHKLNGRMGIATMLTETVRTGRIGWFHRVLEEGHVAPGATLTLRSRPYPEWTIARAYALYKALQNPQEQAPLDDARALAALPPLPESFKASLLAKIERAEARQ